MYAPAFLAHLKNVSHVPPEIDLLARISFAHGMSEFWMQTIWGIYETQIP